MMRDAHTETVTSTHFGFLSDRFPRLDRLQNLISAGCGVIAATAVVGIVALTLWEVLMRTLLNSPQGWVAGLIEECLMVATAFFGIVTAYRAGAHVAIVSVFSMMPPRAQKLILLVIYVIVAVCFALIAIGGWRAMSFSFEMGYVTPPGMADLPVPIWIWSIPVPVASALGFGIVIIDIWKELVTPWSAPVTDHASVDVADGNTRELSVGGDR